MCLNKRFVINPYTHRSILVDCGVCPSCLQKKAQGRKHRIDATNKKGYTWYFLTLTYENKFLPYILKSDLKNHELRLPVYRDYDRALYRSTSDYVLDDSPRPLDSPIDYIDLDEDWYERFAHGRIFSAIGKRNAVGICYYKDLQNFLKRLRICLKRNYNYSSKFYYFACQEYGETNYRPHTHVLLHAPSSDESIFRSAVNKCWRFDSQLPRKFEVARCASSYVSTYVNCDSRFPLYLKSKALRAKHSYSQDFGLDYTSFGLPYLLSKSDTSDLTYTLSVLVKGSPKQFNLPIPKYVINRHFPLFTGYCRLSNAAVYDLVKSAISDKPLAFFNTAYNIFFEHGLNPVNHLYSYLYSKDEIKRLQPNLRYEKIQTSLKNAYHRYLRLYPYSSPVQYAQYYVDVWQSFNRTKFALWYKNKDGIPLLEQFDNVADAFLGHVYHSGIDSFVRHEFQDKGDISYEMNPNNFHHNMIQNYIYENMYYQKLKKRKVINKSLVDQGYNY